MESNYNLDMMLDIKNIIYQTIIEKEGAELDAHLYLIFAEEAAQRILDYLLSAEGIPT